MPAVIIPQQRRIQPAAGTKLSSNFPGGFVWNAADGMLTPDGYPLSMYTQNASYTGERIVTNEFGLALRHYADSGGNADDTIQAPQPVPTSIGRTLTTVFVGVVGSVSYTAELSNANSLGHVIAFSTSGVNLGYDAGNGYTRTAVFNVGDPRGLPFSIVISTCPGSDIVAAARIGDYFCTFADSASPSGFVSYIGQGSISSTSGLLTPSSANGWAEYYHFDGTLNTIAVIPDAFLTQGLANDIVVNPWLIFAPEQQVFYFGSGSSGVTGSLSASESGSDSAEISGAVEAKASVSGSETAVDSTTAAGTVSVIGSMNFTESGADSAAFSGSVTYPDINGNLSATESGADSASVTGVISVNASLSATESTVDDASVTGAIAATGTLSATESGGDTASITGNTDNAVHGSLSATETGTDSAGIAGNVAATGSLSAAESSSDNATISGSANIIGALGADETNTDSVSIAGHVGDIVIAGNLAATEGDADIASAGGAVGIVGAISATESAGDSAAFAGGEVDTLRGIDFVLPICRHVSLSVPVCRHLSFSLRIGGG